MLNPQDVQMSNAVVTGILYVCFKQATVLFDSGAMHSFISPFAACLNKKMCMLDNPLMVLTSAGEVYSISKVLKECAVQIENEIFSGNLMVLDILEFDVILDMDWLSSNHTVLDSYEKTVILTLPDKIVLKCQGDRRLTLPYLISAVSAKRLLNRVAKDTWRMYGMLSLGC